MFFFNFYKKNIKRFFSSMLQIDTSSLYLAVTSTHTAVEHFQLLVRRSGTRCLTSSEIRRVVLAALNSLLMPNTHRRRDATR